MALGPATLPTTAPDNNAASSPKLFDQYLADCAGEWNVTMSIPTVNPTIVLFILKLSWRGNFGIKCFLLLTMVNLKYVI
jgi:hypothetical protein